MGTEPLIYSLSIIRYIIDNFVSASLRQLIDESRNFIYFDGDNITFVGTLYTPTRIRNIYNVRQLMDFSMVYNKAKHVGARLEHIMNIMYDQTAEWALFVDAFCPALSGTDAAICVIQHQLDVAASYCKKSTQKNIDVNVIFSDNELAKCVDVTLSQINMLIDIDLLALIETMYDYATSAFAIIKRANVDRHLILPVESKVNEARFWLHDIFSKVSGGVILLAPYDVLSRITSVYIASSTAIEIVHSLLKPS